VGAADRLPRGRDLDQTLTVAVNVSAVQIHHANFANVVHQILFKAYEGRSIVVYTQRRSGARRVAIDVSTARPARPRLLTAEKVKRTFKWAHTGS
jgi:hypothetical protein